MKTQTIIFLWALLSSSLNAQSAHNDTITLIAVGDIMQGTNFPNASYLPPAGRNLLEPLQVITRNADVTFGNCEGTFLDRGGIAKTCDDSTRCYAFRQPTIFADYLADAGFDLMSLANNHSGDFGDKGRTSTMYNLSRVGIYHAGYASWPDTIFTKNGVRYGFCAFSPNKGTMSIHNIAAAQNVVRNLAAKVDIVIVSMHGGAEGDSTDHVTRETEWFLGENRGNVYQFAHAMIDAGADVIFGSGPHVTRAIELYNDRIIAYSLGNFCTYARFNLRDKGNHGPLLKIEVDKNGRFLAGQVIGIKQPGSGGPVLDPTGRAINEMRKLSLEDFPESPLVIDRIGRILRKKS